MNYDVVVHLLPIYIHKDKFEVEILVNNEFVTVKLLALTQFMNLMTRIFQFVIVTALTSRQQKKRLES